MMEIMKGLEHVVGAEYALRDVRSVVAGVSGGADSVALLLASVAAGVRVHAVHCNFHLRGDESDRDEMFVSRLCARLGIPLDTVHFDVQRYMSEHEVSTEMACRELRYAEFRSILSRTGYDRIAVAHNADDNAETLLLNLMRGAGVAGLRGMLPDTGEIIRPLLAVTRADIEEYLGERQQDFVTDSTNLSCDYRRNFIRNRVLPLLESEWPSARLSIRRTQSNLRQEESVLQWAESMLTEPDSMTLAYADISRCPEPHWVIRRFISRFGGTSAQASEIARAIASAGTLPGKCWKVNGGRIVTERDGLEFIDDSHADCRTTGITHILHSMDATLMDRIRTAPLQELWTSLSPDRIVFRHPRRGDRIRPLGMSGSTAVSKILKDARLSRAQKEAAVVAEHRDSGEIIWIDGLKRSRIGLVDPASAEAHLYTITGTEHAGPVGGFK